MTEQAIFLAALEFADPAERVAYLARACAGDAGLRRQIEALLTAHELPGAFLDEPACEQMAAGPSPPEDGREAPEVNAKGTPTMAERTGQQDLDETEGEQHEDDIDNALDLLQPPTKPGALGRLEHYEVLEVLGKGGFGIVLKAFDEMLHRVVAIKIMAPHLASTSPARKRFLREARAAAAIRHENVVDIHSVAEQPIPYLVMEYIAGETLQQKLDRVGPLDVQEVLRIGRQVARGLAAAHTLGLYHRDIKPGNILLESGVEQRVKITDFGLARTADDASLTQSGYIAGTPMYMAPEQALGHRIDQRADLFSIGSVLYVMCSGRPPFRAANTLAVLKRVAEDTPRPIREIIPEVPEWLCAIVERLHAKSPADRFGSAQEIADLLTRYEVQLKRQERLPPLPPVSQSATQPLPAVREPSANARPQTGTRPDLGSPAAAEAGRSGKRRLRWLVALAGGMAALAVLVSVSVLLVQALLPTRGKAPADPKAPVVFRALADQPWQDAGVDVVEGEPLVLAPNGVWRKGKQTCSAAGLEQAPRDRAVWQEAPLLCLLVRIGDEPTATPVRQREVFKPRRSGRLFVQANDLDLEGNSDALQLTVTGGLCLGDAAPHPGLLPIQAADRDWKPILALAEGRGDSPDRVREDLLEFCRKYAGTPHAASAARWLQKLPLVSNTLDMKLALIPPGEFMMGSDTRDGDAEDDEFVDKAAGRKEKHLVRITRPFYLGVTEVTRGQFRQFVDDAGYLTEAEKDGKGGWGWDEEKSRFEQDPRFAWLNPGFEQTDEHPVVNVSWNDASAFCEWLSRKEGKSYRLPTEAEWEYACRVGGHTRYGFDDELMLSEFAWYAANSGGRTHPVGKKRAKTLGLQDTNGNVFEWCADWYGPEYYKQSPPDDPPGPGKGWERVTRGGGWRDDWPLMRTARRGRQPPDYRDCNLGFRLALVRFGR